jgi:hypothetical protein
MDILQKAKIKSQQHGFSPPHQARAPNGGYASPPQPFGTMSSAPQQQQQQFPVLSLEDVFGKEF